MKQLSIFDVLQSHEKKPLPEEIADKWHFDLQYHDVEDVRYYAVQDWIKGIAQTDNPKRFISDMKRRYSELYAPCVQLKYLASNGRNYTMDFATDEVLYQITQRMDTTTGLRNTILDYLAKAGVRLDEYRLDPEKAVQDGLASMPQRQLGGPYKDSKIWRAARLEGMIARHEFTQALHDAVVNPDYRSATNDTYQGVFGFVTSELYKYLGVPKGGNPRDYMATGALAMLRAAEFWMAQELEDYPDMIPMEKATQIIQVIAETIGVAQRQLSEKTGRDVLTGQKLLKA